MMKLSLSPASDDGADLVISGCPAFSWSEVEEAVSYRIAVYETDELAAALAHGEMARNRRHICRLSGRLFQLKTAIQPLESSLQKILALEGISYRWKTDRYPDWGFPDTRQVGLVAQEMAKARRRKKKAPTISCSHYCGSIPAAVVRACCQRARKRW
jgi:hypothetical protein